MIKHTYRGYCNILIVLGIVFYPSISNYLWSKPMLEFNQDPVSVEYLKAGNEYLAGDYAEAIIYYQQVIEKSRSANKKILLAHSYIGMARCYRKLGNIKEAIRYIENAEEICRLSGHTSFELEAAILVNRALIYTDMGDYERSVKTLHKSYGPVKQSIFKDSIFALICNAMGRNFAVQGILDSALNCYSRAIEFKTKGSEKPDHELAVYFKNLSAIYSRMGNFQEAMINIKKSLQIFHALDQAGILNMASSYNTLANIHYKQGMYETAMKYYDSAEMIYSARAGKDYFKLYDVYEGKANIYYVKADFPGAVEYYEKSIRALMSVDTISISRLSRSKYMLGLIYIRQDDISQALRCFGECIQLNREYNPFMLASSYHAYAKCLEKEEKPLQANQYYRLAIENRIKFYGKNHPALAYDYLNYGIFLNGRGDSVTGIGFLEKAEKIYLESYGTKHPATSEIFTRMASFYRNQKDLCKALDYYQKAIIAATGNFKSNDIYENPSPEDVDFETKLLSTLKGKGETLFEHYKTSKKVDTAALNLSMQTLQLATTILHDIRTKSYNEETERLLAVNEKKVFVKGMEVALELYELTGDVTCYEAALSFASGSKSSILFASINEASAKIEGNVPESYRTQLKQLNQKISSYQKLIFDEIQYITPDSIKLNTWKDELFEYRTEYKKLIKEIEKKYPEYYALKFAVPELDFNDLRKRINRNEVLIEYVVHEDMLYSFLISKELFRHKIINLDTLFKQNIETILFLLYEKHPFEQSMEDMKLFGRAASYLYNILISPFNTLIENKDLIIIPDGRLTYLPFEILVSGKKKDLYYYHDLEYLIKQHAVSYLYSTSLIKKSLKGVFNKLSISAFFPKYDSQQEFEDPGNDMTKDNKLKDLPFTGAEREYIERMGSNNIFSAEHATKARFISELDNPNILHLSMHGIVDSLNPLYSKFVFTETDDSLRDHFLHTYEIYNLQTNSILSVMNVCNAGYGLYLSGEGIISLTRAFFYAGCRCLVSSLWSVNDESGSRVIIEFYKHLIDGNNVSRSMQLAKTDYLKNADAFHSHPHFWASYQVIGDSSIVFHNWRRIIIYTSILIIILAVTVGFYLMKRRQKR